MTQTAYNNNSNHSYNFETDVARLLDIVANALYSNKDVFLRELISNAADACDRLRYDLLQCPDIVTRKKEAQIQIISDNETNTITLTDNGIGMNNDDLINNLGTIAHSGTSAILEAMKQKGQDKDISLIGQFGVGFYASFMVADRVDVISRKAGDDSTWHWHSDGKSGYTLSPAEEYHTALLPDVCGTSIVLHLKKEAYDYLLSDKLKQIILAYSDHIEVPIFVTEKSENKQEGENPINTAKALWVRPKDSITPEQYKEFYHHIGNIFDEPLMTTHWTAEGKIEYTALLYVPSMRPWDLYDPERKNCLRLYVKRVFITDKLDTLVYPWLRFVRGIVDSQDLPLNISRELLQSNAVVQKIRSGITKKILSEIDKLSRQDEVAFSSLWQQFGMVIKEGLYDAVEHREDIFKICRFFTTQHPEKPTSLNDYVTRMKEGQNHIYYMTGDSITGLRHSPQLEGFAARGLEVLLMADTVDDFWLQQVHQFSDKKFQSITKGNIDLSKFEKNRDKEDKDSEKAENNNNPSFDNLLSFLSSALKDQVSFVRLSERLTESPVCLVADDAGVDMHMEKVLKLQQKYQPTKKPVLEINPDHALIKKLATLCSQDNDNLQDAAHLLMDQALIIQGEPLPNTADFARRMAKFLEMGL